MAGVWGVTPRASVRAEAARVGADAVVDRCLAVLAGETPEPPFLRVLAGPAVDGVLAGYEGGLDGRWPRVWALRGLLHVWEPRAAGAVVAALADDAWRCREMAAKVVAAHRVDEALESLAPLLEDLVPRVRAAAGRARMQLSQQ
ncbi:MAG: hypothetical protein ABIO67_02710 [Mycobacteriales bacterium]